jgi:hypothetical protein
MVVKVSRYKVKRTQTSVRLEGSRLCEILLSPITVLRTLFLMCFSCRESFRMQVVVKPDRLSEMVWAEFTGI